MSYTAYSSAPGALPAGSGLSAALGYFVKLSAGVVVPCDSQGERSIGILGANVATANEGVNPHAIPGEIVSIRVGSNGVTSGSEVCSASDGRAENAASNDIVHGIALATGTVGELVRMYIVSPYAKA